MDLSQPAPTHCLLEDVSELPEGRSSGFSIAMDTGTLDIFVVHYGGRFYAYENHCPHTGINLNWQPQQFLDITGERIQCSTHGALFRITDGLCEWGPCVNQHLRPLEVYEENGQLMLNLPAKT